MVRPTRKRCVGFEPEYELFSPDGIASDEVIELNVDEYETIRLIDYEHLNQNECALKMKVSRPTVSAIYESARHKIAESIVLGKRMQIKGGKYILEKSNVKLFSETLESEKGERQMRIAVTYEEEMIFQHFGHSTAFKVYDVENGEIVRSEILNTNGSGHGALAGLLQLNKVDALICGGIGAGAINALKNAGINVYGGVSGRCDDAINAFINNNLNYNPDVKCSHHDHDENHNCGNHGCGQGGCH